MAGMVNHMSGYVATRRRHLGLSLDQVAERAGTSKSYIWEIEHGRTKNPTVNMALALCDALQCSLNSLLGLDVSQPRITDDEMALIEAHRRIFARRAQKEGE